MFYFVAYTMVRKRVFRRGRDPHSPFPVYSPQPTSNEQFCPKRIRSEQGVRLTRRSVRATILRNSDNTSLGPKHPAHA